MRFLRPREHSFRSRSQPRRRVQSSAHAITAATSHSKGNASTRALYSNYKEAFNVGLELAANHPEVLAGKPFRGVNLWPAISGWRETVLPYYDACWDLGRRIQRGFALDLGIAEDFFENKLDVPLAILRMLHHPPQPQRRDQAPESGPACTPITTT